MFRKELAAKIYPVDELAAKRLFTIPMLDIEVNSCSSLLYAFCWSDTPYGSYWNTIDDKVRAWYR